MTHAHGTPRRTAPTRPAARVALHGKARSMLQDAVRVASTTSTLEAWLEVVQGEEAIRVVAYVPGAGEDDIDVQLDGDLLTIRSEARRERPAGDTRLPCVVRSFGAAQWNVRLPHYPDPDGVQAVFRDSTLTLTLLPAGA